MMRVQHTLLGTPQIEVHTEHIIHGGIYTRTIRMKPGTYVMGALYKVPTTVVLSGNLCFIYHGPGKGAHLVALNKKDGRTVWKYDEPAIDVGKRTDGFRGQEPGIICTYSTPLVVKAAGRDELIMSFPRYLRAFDPETGKELWHCDGLNPLVYTSPIYSDGIAVAMGGFSTAR